MALNYQQLTTQPTTVMTYNMEDIEMGDVIDDILSELGEEKVIKEPSEEVTLPELVPTDWVDRDDGIGRMRRVLFSEKFWKPETVPDHLVTEFEGYPVGSLKWDYIPPKAEFERLSLSFSLKMQVMIVGPTGAGKTQMCEYFAIQTGRPFLRIEHSHELDKATVFGQTHINALDDGTTETDFVPGVLPTSFDAPTLVVLDELSRATGYANMIYQRVLDRREMTMPELKGKGAEILTPDPEWLIAATDNTKGNGDDLDKYSASNVQDAAFINRWHVLIEQGYLSVEEEETLIKTLSSSMSIKDRKALAKFSALMHAGVEKGEIQTAFSPRNLQVVCQYVDSGVPVKQAVEWNYVSRCAKSELSDVNSSLNAAFGGK